MKPRRRHRWDLSPRSAVLLQRRLARAIILHGPPLREPLIVAGCDAAGTGRWAARDEEIVAAVVVLRVPGWECVDSAWVRRRSTFPYVPGLLSFREIPAYLEAFERIRVQPDVVLCDGQGIAHPRGFGLAAHLGLLLDIPTIGVAKSRLIGEHRVPGISRGASAQLRIGERVVGRVVRTQNRVRPLYVSPGHRVSIDAAARLVVRLAPRYRLPEPTRLADIWVRRLKAGEDVQPPAACEYHPPT